MQFGPVHQWQYRLWEQGEGAKISNSTVLLLPFLNALKKLSIFIKYILYYEVAIQLLSVILIKILMCFIYRLIVLNINKH